MSPWVVTPEIAPRAQPNQQRTKRSSKNAGRYSQSPLPLIYMHKNRP